MSLTLPQHTHTHFLNISVVVVVPMPRPALQHQLPLLLPLNAICVVVPRGARCSLSSSSSHMTSDTPPDPSGPLQGCPPRTLTTRAMLRHLSPTGKPGPVRHRRSLASLSGENEDGAKGWKRRGRYQKFHSA